MIWILGIWPTILWLAAIGIWWIGSPWWAVATAAGIAGIVTGIAIVVIFLSILLSDVGPRW